MKTPSLASTKLKAQLSLLASLSRSTDPAILKLNTILNDPGHLWRSEINQPALELHQKAEEGQPRKTLKIAIKKLATEEEKRKCNSLQVQGKFSEIVSLDEDTKVVQQYKVLQPTSCQAAPQRWRTGGTHEDMSQSW